MIIEGAKIVAVKDVEGIVPVGTVCEVVGIPDKLIHFRFGDHLGLMTFDEFQEYFEEVKSESKENAREWSEWIETTIYGWGHYIDAQYRENGKKVQVRTKFGLTKEQEKQYLKAEASCLPTDEFNFDTGYDLAIKRLFVKIVENDVIKMLLKIEVEDQSKTSKH